MLTRRTLILATIALAPLAAAVTLPRAARALSPEAARQFIKQTADELVGAINSPGSPEQKRAQLQQIIDRAVAVEDVARFCLGAHWRAATPEERQQYVELFHRVLLNSVSGHLGEYKGLSYGIGRPAPGEGGITVPTVINRPGQPQVNLTWVVGDGGGAPKIIDLIAEGASLRITQRSDYDAYLQHNGGKVQALLEALRRQVSQTG
jgi:phospholipid transport system substrate-binding protein